MIIPHSVEEWRQLDPVTAEMIKIECAKEMRDEQESNGKIVSFIYCRVFGCTFTAFCKKEYAESSH